MERLILIKIYFLFLKMKQWRWYPNRYLAPPFLEDKKLNKIIDYISIGKTPEAKQNEKNRFFNITHYRGHECSEEKRQSDFILKYYQKKDPHPIEEKIQNSQFVQDQSNQEAINYSINTIGQTNKLSRDLGNNEV